MMHNPRGF